MLKKAFYFTLKALFFLKIFKFLSQLFGHAGKQIDSKEKFNFIIYNIKTWLSIKLGQLIEYNMRNNFLEKSYTKCDGESTPRSFSKKSQLSISLDQ